MKYKNASIQEPIKKMIWIVVIAVLLILFAFLSLQSLARQREYQDKIILSAFGEQEMYTQMISKDVSRIYLLLQVKDSGHEYDMKAIDQKLIDIKKDLTSVREEFSKNLDEIRNNKVSYLSYTVEFNDDIIKSSQHLKEIEQYWSEFEEAIEIFYQAEQVNPELANALIFINNNNMELMNHCDHLKDQILRNSLSDDKQRQYATYILIGVLIIIIFFSLYQLQRYLIQPFSQLYKGIAQIGLDSYPVRSGLPTKKKIVPIVTEINSIFHKIKDLISLMENMSNNDSFVETLGFISKTFTSYIPYNYIGIALISEDKKYLKATYGVSDGTIVGLQDSIRGTSWLISDTSLGELIQTGNARIINDLEKHCEGKQLKQYNKMILEKGVRSSITLPLKVSGEPVGIIFFSSIHKNVYLQEHMNFLKTLANSIAISLNQSIFVNDVVYSSILALAKLAEARDEDTGEHLERMSKYTRFIAELLLEHNIYTDEINLEFVDNIERFSPLHDIGKVGIRDDILLKPGKLSPEEYEEMKKHASYGAEVLRTAEMNLQKRSKSLFGIGIEIAEGHHEKWDGSGYPYGKKGTEIPLSARIVALADVFDALSSKRPYKEAFSFERTMEIIAMGKGKHFDPVIVDKLLANLKKIEQIYLKYKA